METRTHINPSRRRLAGAAPEGRPKARPSGPTVNGCRPRARPGDDRHGDRPGRSPRREAICAGGELSSCGAGTAPRQVQGASRAVPDRPSLSGGMDLGHPALGCRCRPRPQAIVARLEAPQTGCGDQIRTGDLRLMRPASYRCSTHAKKIEGRDHHSAASMEAGPDRPVASRSSGPAPGVGEAGP